ncbi:MAG: PCMD domain-containing protein [Muribaculaceae bacterium]|nr:PCMD domain-containing protein [Muribaculaceae bacterium]
MKLLKPTTTIFFSLVVIIAAMSSCIENDIPYPHLDPKIVSMVAKNQSRAAVIDAAKHSVTLYFDENADIANVDVIDYQLSEEDATIDDSELHNMDLRTPKTITVTLYYDYKWTISAQQTIDRNFSISAQVGSSTIDVPGLRAVAYISSTQDITKVKVNSIKLGSSKSKMSPDFNNAIVDFSSPQIVKVTDYGRTEQWTVYVEPAQASVNTDRVDAWVNVAWLYGTAEEGKHNGFEYRLATATEWTPVPDAWVTHNGGSFTGRLIHLAPNNKYVARAVSDDDKGNEVEFTTESVPFVPNMSFDDWYLDGKVWNPWAESGTSYWDTGNKGATTLGNSNSYPTTETPSGKGYAACLETKFVGIGIVGKLAAGNIFTGRYARTDGTNGVLDFGREYSGHPTTLRGKMKYKCVPISHSNNEYTHLKGRPDTASIYVALADWSAPYEIRTNPADRQLFDPNSSDVIAYGQLLWGKSVNDWTDFEVNIVYKDTYRKPRYIVIVASASKYGDFFTGGDGSILWIDDFSLEYDY